jgi:hypothetical protein
MGSSDDEIGSLWRLAVHETGHALIYVVHGGTVTALAARPWVQAGGVDGYCEGEVSADIKAMGGGIRHVHGACAALAGRVAEHHFFKSIDAAGCNQDLQDFSARVRQVDAAWGTGAPVEAWEAAIGEMVRPAITAHERVIAYVARTLADERSMGERRAMELFGVARKLWGIQPGPLVGPSWRARLEAALTRHRTTRTDERFTALRREHAAPAAQIDGQEELRAMRDRIVARHGLRL